MSGSEVEFHDTVSKVFDTETRLLLDPSALVSYLQLEMHVSDAKDLNRKGGLMLRSRFWVGLVVLL